MSPFHELSKERYSLRDFSDRPVEQEKLDEILEVGRISPTAANFQPQKVYVFQSEEALDKLRGLTKQVRNAPVAILICFDEDQSWKASGFNEPEYDDGPVDAAIVTNNMMMEAADLGVGSLWIRGFNGKELAKGLGLPENEHPIAILALGYPSESAKPSPMHESRKELSETVTIL